MKRLLLCTLLGTTFLSACGKQDTPADNAFSCEAPATLSALQEQIQAEAVMLLKHHDFLPAGDYSAEAVAQAFQHTGFTLSDVRTVKNEAQLSCEATLRLKLTPEAKTRLQQSVANHALILDATQPYDLDKIILQSEAPLQTDGHNGYMRTLAYTVARTDSDSKTVVSTDSKTAALSLTPVLRFYLAHDQLKADADEVRKAEAADHVRQQELDALNQAQLQARLEAAKTENRDWHRQLNQNWQSLPPAARSALKTGQEQWNRLRESECAYYGKSESSEPLEQEVLRLECDSQRVQQRLPELTQSAETHLLAAVNEVRRQNQQADQEIRRVWQSIPDDVKAIIGQDYQNWNSTTSAKCAATAQQAGSSHAAQLARLECEIEETRRKINELRGYVAQ